MRRPGRCRDRCARSCRQASSGPHRRRAAPDERSKRRAGARRTRCTQGCRRSQGRSFADSCRRSSQATSAALDRSLQRRPARVQLGRTDTPGIASPIRPSCEALYGNPWQPLAQENDHGLGLTVTPVFVCGFHCGSGSPGSSSRDRDAGGTRTPRWPNDDPDMLIRQDQRLHQTFQRDVLQLVASNLRHPGLRHAGDVSGLDPAEAAPAACATGPA